MANQNQKNRIFCVLTCLCICAAVVNGRWGPSGQREPFDEPVDEPFDVPVDEPPVAECADTIGKLLDLQRQACEKLNDATMQALCVLPLAQCLRSGPTLPKEPQSDVLPIKHVLPHAPQAAMHAAPQAKVQAAAHVAHTLQALSSQWTGQAMEMLFALQTRTQWHLSCTSDR